MEGDNPAINISWFDAALYCNWLNKQIDQQPMYILENKQQVVINAFEASPVPGQTSNRFADYYEVTLNEIPGSFRLPREAEWEYAARGGIKHDPFMYSGSNNINEVAWYRNNSNKRTHKIGTKRSNSAGLHDMSGNVWEWCYDYWYVSNSESWNKGTSPNPGLRNQYKVIRGGSWNYNDINSRVANRFKENPAAFYVNTGFRVAR